MKNYKNEELQKRVEAVVNHLTIPDDFKPFITDLLMRRFYQYDFSEEEIQMDLNTISTSLFDIKLSNLVGNIYGFYSHIDRSITLSKEKFLKRDPEIIYSYLAHELYHALCFDIYNLDRLSALDERHTFNIVTGKHNYTLLEAFVEKGSYRTVFATTLENAYTNDNANGYSDITFVVDMIASAFGVKEQALLKHGIQSRKKLAEFLANNSNYNIETVSFILDQIEANYVILHNSLYERDNPRHNNERDGLNSSYAIGNMTNICISIMQQRFNSIPKSQLSQEIIEDYMFQYNKLLNVVEKASGHFEYSKSYDPAMKSFSSEVVGRGYKRRGIDFQNNLLSHSRNGFGIRTTEIEKFGFNQDSMKRNIENDEKNEPWDNEEITKKFKKTIKRVVRKNQRLRIRNAFKRKQKALPITNYDKELDFDILNLVSISYGVSIDDLRQSHSQGKDKMVELIANRTGIKPEEIIRQFTSISDTRHRVQRLNFLNKLNKKNEKDHTLEFEKGFGDICSTCFDILRERVKATQYEALTPSKIQELQHSYTSLVETIKSSITRIDNTRVFEKISPERILFEFQTIAVLCKNSIIQTHFLKGIDFKNRWAGIGMNKINDILKWAGNGVLQNYGRFNLGAKPLTYYGIFIPIPITERQFRDNDYRLNSSQKGIKSWMAITPERHQSKRKENKSVQIRKT